MDIHVRRLPSNIVQNTDLINRRDFATGRFSHIVSDKNVQGTGISRMSDTSIDERLAGVLRRLGRPIGTCFPPKPGVLPKNGP